MLNVPTYIAITFILTTLLTVAFFYFASKKSIITLVILLVWLLVQMLIGLTDFYTDSYSLPPRFLVLILPPVIFIILLFTIKKVKDYIDNLDLKMLTLLHIVRTPVELVLLWLFVYKAVPELMTFEGRNFDILSGITAPFIFYFGFVKQNMNKKIILIWNFICLGLLINIVVNAILSAPFPFQQFAFEQPNIAVLHFPFNWLPACVVPLVLFSHLVVIRQLMKSKTSVI